MVTIRAALVDAIIAALPVALVYFSGWAYLTSYLAQFGIDATQFDVSFTTVLVYAFVPLQACIVLLMAVGITACGFLAYLVELHSDETSKRGRALAALFCLGALVGVVVLLFAIKDAATVAAKEMADKVWSGKKSQTIMLLDDLNKDDASVRLYNICREGRRLRQIIGLPHQMFLMCLSEVDSCNRGTLFAINDNGRMIYAADKVRGGIDDRKICAL